jgi:hypothetical protein
LDKTSDVNNISFDELETLCNDSVPRYSEVNFNSTRQQLATLDFIAPFIPDKKNVVNAVSSRSAAAYPDSQSLFHNGFSA